MFDLSTTPVVFSHAAMRTVHDSVRKITDAQALVCVRTGGVIGICGVGTFLGNNDATVTAMLRRTDHLVDLVGPEHVGIGSDFTFDVDEVNVELLRYPHLLFPDEFQQYGQIAIAEPEALSLIGRALTSAGHPRRRRGGNFRRIARQVWR